MRWVVAQASGKAFRTERGEITRALRVRDQRKRSHGCRLGKERFGIIREEEKLVFDDRSAEGEAKIVIVQRSAGCDFLSRIVAATHKQVANGILGARVVVCP